MPTDKEKEPETKSVTSESATVPPELIIEYAKIGAVDLLHRMVERGVDVNVQDERGMTALHHAAAIGARPCIRSLVASGRCDYLLKDNEHRYAYELAIEWAADHAVGRLLAKKQRQQAARERVPAWLKK